MNIKELNQFMLDYELKPTQKLFKYLVIIGIQAMKTKTSDISIETIKLIASSCKQQKLRDGMAELKEKVINIQQSLSPQKGNFNFYQPKSVLNSKDQLMNSQFSPILKKKDDLQIKSKKAQIQQDIESNLKSLNFNKKENNQQANQFQQKNKPYQLPQQSNNYFTQKKVSLDQIANNFLSSPLVKNPVSARNITQKESELKHFFQNSWKLI
ncbi:unnamed protein product (macronuclear) [Paramecium tetraurelia]|uniref:Uncharacterized protein n=1 Tax=Paramecium tetraurelia TaxID=5888 RepID=A0CL91_PARTE|nr:uncharacterized protein GSPATT00008105001 [Paramecium tetraurelia]CAK71558.1 unnamed protein product [Paramecium tetraurelia]|eukprot:XP_001438955.1 hypothetical protein (macronuclear) [Paramecium tetraurelia strain d4-2]